MSKLTDTKRAYEEIAGLLDQQIRKGGNRAKELERFRDALRAAFYLLGWAQFEHLVRTKAKDIIENQSRSKTIDGHAWRFVSANLKGVRVRDQLDIIFHADQKLRQSLKDDYQVRNDVAHNYKLLPPEAQDIAAWLDDFEKLIDKF